MSLVPLYLCSPVHAADSPLNAQTLLNHKIHLTASEFWFSMHIIAFCTFKTYLFPTDWSYPIDFSLYNSFETNSNGYKVIFFTARCYLNFDIACRKNNKTHIMFIFPNLLSCDHFILLRAYRNLQKHYVASHCIKINIHWLHYAKMLASLQLKGNNYGWKWIVGACFDD